MGHCLLAARGLPKARLMSGREKSPGESMR